MFVAPTKLEKYCYPMNSSSLGNFIFLPWKLSFPTLEIFFSYLGNFLFLRWKLFVPTLELKSSSLGTEKFLRWN